MEVLMLTTLFGVLGVTIFISKDPLEQINRAEDISLESDASSLSSALKEYYKKNHKYPWGKWTFGSDAFFATEEPMNLNELTKGDELESGFLQKETLKKLLLIPYSAKNAIMVCFEPKSKEFKRLAGKDCVKVGDSECMFCSK